MNSINVEELYRQIGLKIKEMRQRHKPQISQQTLGRKIGISRASMVNIEKGRHHIQIHTLFNIANSLGIKVNDLLPEFDGEKSIQITTGTEFSPKTKLSLEKIISNEIKKDVKIVG